MGCTQEHGWAVAVGAISVGLALIHALVASFKPNLADKWAPYLSTILLLLWIPGAGVLTFRAPFLTTGNGYFASWAALVASLVFFQRNALAAIAGTREEPQSASAV